MTAPVEAETFRAAMRLTASGVAVITTDGPAGRAGITVSTFQSFSVAPPSVMVCINRESRNLAKIEKNGAFCANVLAADQKELAGVFAGPSAEARERCFSDATAWRVLATGAPALQNALCVFDCRVADVFSFASHRIVIGAVQAVTTGASEPLVYSGRGYRRLQPQNHDDLLSAKGEFSIPFEAAEHIDFSGAAR